MKQPIILAALLLLTACTDAHSTVRTLRNHGFTDIQVTGWSPLACSEDDTFSTGFEATNPQGHRVSGTVCCGLLTKACTVRF